VGTLEKMLTRGFLISFAIEFGPICLFFLGTELGNFFVGTALLVASTALALLTSLIRDKRVPLFSVISSSFVLAFGIATLILMDPLWLVLEYTLYNGLFGLAMFIGLLFGKPLLKPLFEGMFQISDYAWKLLSIRWGIFFLLTAVANEYVWHNHTEEAWVYFRLIAAVVLCVFGFSQFFLARRERLPHASPWGLRI